MTSNKDFLFKTFYYTSKTHMTYFQKSGNTFSLTWYIETKIKRNSLYGKNSWKAQAINWTQPTEMGSVFSYILRKLFPAAILLLAVGNWPTQSL